MSSSRQPGVAAALHDFAIDADIAELVDDEREPPALGIREEVADERRLAGAEEAGDDGCRDLLSDHGQRRFDSRRSLRKPISRPSTAQNTAAAASVGGEGGRELGGHAAFMGRRLRRADEVRQRQQSDAEDDEPTRLARQCHERKAGAGRSDGEPPPYLAQPQSSAAGMPGSSGGSPAAGASEKARKPARPHRMPLAA